MTTVPSYVSRAGEGVLVRRLFPAASQTKVFELKLSQSSDWSLRSARSAAKNTRRSCFQSARIHRGAKLECPLDSIANRLRLQRPSEIQAEILRTASTNRLSATALHPGSGPDCRIIWDSAVAKRAKSERSRNVAEAKRDARISLPIRIPAPRQAGGLNGFRRWA